MQAIRKLELRGVFMEGKREEWDKGKDLSFFKDRDFMKGIWFRTISGFISV